MSRKGFCGFSLDLGKKLFNITLPASVLKNLGTGGSSGDYKCDDANLPGATLTILDCIPTCLIIHLLPMWTRVDRGNSETLLRRQNY